MSNNLNIDLNVAKSQGVCSLLSLGHAADARHYKGLFYPFDAEVGVGNGNLSSYCPVQQSEVIAKILSFLCSCMKTCISRMALGGEKH
jgi:hypothetical protein